MIDPDIKQRFKVIGIFLLQSYKILTGTMLSIFIPQSCGDQMCSITENYNNPSVYHKTLVYFNSFSMFLFFCSYLIELRREEWCVKFLDIDNNYSDNGLKDIIRKEEKLDKYMDRINKSYYDMIRITSIIYFINILLTIKMINTNYHSNSTISCFISFTLLVLMKLYNSYTVAHQSVKNDKMMSAYMSEFVSYNVLDEDYVLEKYNGTKNSKLEDITNENNNGENIMVTSNKNECIDHTQINENHSTDISIKEDEIVPIIP